MITSSCKLLLQDQTAGAATALLVAESSALEPLLLLSAVEGRQTCNSQLHSRSIESPDKDAVGAHVADVGGVLRGAPRASEEGVLTRQPTVGRVGNRAEVALLESRVGGVDEAVERVPDAPSQRGGQQRRERIRNASAEEGLVGLGALHGLRVVRHDPDVRGGSVALSIQADCGLDLGALGAVLHAVHGAEEDDVVGRSVDDAGRRDRRRSWRGGKWVGEGDCGGELVNGGVDGPGRASGCRHGEESLERVSVA